MEVNTVKERLTQLGYTVSAADDAAITYDIGAVEKRIMVLMNRTSTPSDIDAIEIDMICGEFLQQKYLLGGLSDFNCDAAVKSISEGDVSINYEDVDSADAKVKSMIDWLMHHGDETIYHYRKLRW